MDTKTQGIISTVVGGAIALWVYTRFTSLMGQMHTWQPPLEDYEIYTFIGAAAAVILIIVGLIRITKKE